MSYINIFALATLILTVAVGVIAYVLLSFGGVSAIIGAALLFGILGFVCYWDNLS